SDGTIRIWDVVSGKEVTRFAGHEAWVSAIAFSPDGQTFASASSDGTILLWKLPPLPTIGAAPDEKSLEAIWETLAGMDAKKAYAAMLLVRDHPGATLPFLQRKVREDSALRPKQVAQLIADLNSSSFQVRDRANQELLRLGPGVAPALEKARHAPPSVEAR